MNIEDKIKQFKNKLKEVYCNLEIGDYSKDEIIFIWHNSKELSNNSKFNTMAGSLIREIFFNDKIFNICFYFDIDKCIEEYKAVSNDIKLNMEKVKFIKQSSYNSFNTSFYSNINWGKDYKSYDSKLNEVKLDSKKINLSKSYIDIYEWSDYSIFVPDDRMVAYING